MFNSYLGDFLFTSTVEICSIYCQFTGCKVGETATPLEAGRDGGGWTTYTNMGFQTGSLLSVQWVDVAQDLQLWHCLARHFVEFSLR